MPNTVANQLEITIRKPKYSRDFLSISKDEWITASALLTYSEFKVFLYLAGNADGYTLAYSPQAISNELTISRGTASEARRSLEALGYIEGHGKNHYTFYTKPRRIEITDTLEPDQLAAAKKQQSAEKTLADKGISLAFR